MLVYNRSLQEASVIDFRETAPAQAHRDMFKGNEKKAKKGILFRFVFSEDFLKQEKKMYRCVLDLTDAISRIQRALGWTCMQHHCD